MKTIHIPSLPWRSISILGLALMFYACTKSELHHDELRDVSSIHKQITSIHKQMTNHISVEQVSKIDYDIRKAFNRQYLSARESLRLSNEQSSLRGQGAVNIYPTGQFPQDVINVQAVIDDAGENNVDLQLILKATNENGDPTAFNFDGGVVIIRGSYWDNQTGDVIIKGEASNGHHTTIIKGFDAEGFGFPNDFKAFYVHDRGDITFKNLKFDKGAIFNFGGLVAPDNMLVKNCVFLDRSHYAGALTNLGTNNSYTIKDNRFENAWRAIGMYNNNNQCIVKDNYFRTEEILYFQTVGYYEFKDNTVNSVALSNPNVYSYGPALVLNFDANFIIKDNHIINEYTQFGTGIFIGPNSDQTQIQIKDNLIEIESEYFGGIDLVGYVYGTPIKNVCITDNEIKGNAAWAISASNDFSLPPSSEISSNTIYGNDLDDFESNCNGIDFETSLNIGCADIFLSGSTTNNYVCAEDAVIVNYGIGNIISDDDDDCNNCGN